MKRMIFSRLTASVLALSLLAVPVAQALTVEQCADLLQKNYVDEVPRSVLEQPTIEAMLNALGDPYTQYFPPTEYTQFLASMSDTSLVGIGVVFSITEEGLDVSRVLDGSPALKGGMAAGDLIIAVDGHSILGEDTTTVTGRIQGEAGTKVDITYLRNSIRTTVTLTRATIVVPSTTTELVDGHIGYIRCTTFGNETVGHFKEGIQANQDKVNIWIVDLRGNLGGVTDAASNAASLFTGAGPIAYLRDGRNAYSVFRGNEEAATLCPVIVLVDRLSASASEIFAAAIQNYGAGIVIGERTFGKGVAQRVLDKTFEPELFPDGDAIKITAFRFYSPLGNTTDQIGVIPDLLVDPDYTQQVAFLLCGADPQNSLNGALRLHIVSHPRLFVDMPIATEHKDVLSAFLNALPTCPSVWMEAFSDKWQRIDYADVAAKFDISYTSPYFSDRDPSLPSDQGISVLRTYGLIQGYGDNTFRPKNQLTRAELCQLLMEVLNATPSHQTSPYSDVADNAWYAPAVIAMTDIGLVNGVGGGQFDPNSPIDHQQFITVMGRMAKWLNISFYDVALQGPAEYEDLSNLQAYSSWAKPLVWLMVNTRKGYFGNSISMLWDLPEAISPTSPTTRDEAAYTLYLLLSNTGVLPS